MIEVWRASWKNLEKRKAQITEQTLKKTHEIYGGRSWKEKGGL